MIQLDSKTLRQLQMIELEMLIEVNRICKKCGIHYTIIAGTMLLGSSFLHVRIFCLKSIDSYVT